MKFARYAWIIDVDKQTFAELDSDVGKLGPRHIHPIYRAHFERAEYPLAVRRWRARDDDGELYYEGRYIGPDDHTFGPLEDFATPNAGATSIEYLNEDTDTWEAL